MIWQLVAATIAMATRDCIQLTDALRGSIQTQGQDGSRHAIRRLALDPLVRIRDFARFPSASTSAAFRGCEGISFDIPKNATIAWANPAPASR